jgi:hypothetical protein
LILLSKFFQKSWMFLLDVSLPRHNSSTQLPSKLPAELLSAPLIWVRWAASSHLFSRCTTAPSQSELGHETRSSRQPPQSLHGSQRQAWQPASPQQTAGVAPRRSCPNQAGLVFRPTGIYTFPSGAASGRSWNRFPTRRGGFYTPGTGGAITGATDAVPVPSTGTATEVRPLTSSPSSRGQSSGGDLWTPAYTPDRQSDQSGVLQ